MLHGSAQTAARWLLSAMLALSGLAPPAIEHAHRDGDRAHGYHREHGAVIGSWDHDADHATGHPHHHADHGARLGQGSLAVAHLEVEPAAGSPVVHRHLLWLGFELTLPAPAEKQPYDEGAGSGGETFVRLIGEQPPELARPALAVDRPPAPLAAPPERITAASARQSLAATAVVAAPLCDTARHERSGVQLI